MNKATFNKGPIRDLTLRKNVNRLILELDYLSNYYISTNCVVLKLEKSNFFFRANCRRCSPGSSPSSEDCVMLIGLLISGHFTTWLTKYCKFWVCNKYFVFHVHLHFKIFIPY